MDIFDKFKVGLGPLGKHAGVGVDDEYFMFPKLVGEIAPRMQFRGREVLNWSLNNYLGLGNHPEVRRADEAAARHWGLAYPMGSRMMSGNTDLHDELEENLARFVDKEDAMLLNYGYQGIFSVIDAMVDRKDVIVYDAESHACIVDGVRMHLGQRKVFAHNDIASLEKQLISATRLANESGGGILVITEGVFGMSGNTGALREVAALKKKYNFRLLVDDAHGFGTMGHTGAGTGEALGVQDDIDVYFSTFAKSMASIGAFVAGKKSVIRYLRYNTRSQIYAKSLPMAFVESGIKRLEMLRTMPELREKLWTIVNALQDGLRERGFNIGTTQSPVTPVILSAEIGEAAELAFDLRENFSIFCSVVIYPVVPKDIIMLRVIPTASHTLEDVSETITAFEAIQHKLTTGVYKKGELAATFQ